MRRSRNPRFPLVKLCALLVALSMLGGCEPGRRTPERAAGPATPTTAAVSMADYAGRLESQVGRIKSSMSLVVRAKTYEDLKLQVQAAQLTARDVSLSMGSLLHPPEADGPHDRFMKQLSDLSSQLSKATDRVDGQKLCAAPSVVASLNKSGVVKKLDAAGQELAAATGGLYEHVRLVPAGKSTTRHLATGTVIRNMTGPGINQITVDNQFKRLDVVLTLAKGKRPVYSVYIRSKSKATFRRIPNGSYTAYLTSGVDWDRKLRTFTRDCYYERVKGSQKLTTTASYYTIWQLQLGVKSGSGKKLATVPSATQTRV